MFTFKYIDISKYFIVLRMVLDPFMGSGTTAIAAKNLNRDYIGVELLEEYKNVVLNRISKECK